MPFETIWEKNGIRRKFNGFVTGKEMCQAIEEVQGHVLFDSIFYVINDYLDVTGYDVTTNDVMLFVALNRAVALTNPNLKVALVTTEPTIQALAALYGDLIRRSAYMSEVFTNINDATIWATTPTG